MTRTGVLARALSLLLLLSGAAGVGVPAATAGPREAMADAMVRMMDAMGLFDPSSLSAMAPGTPFGAPGWAPGFSGFGMPGASPWELPSSDPSGAMGKGGEMMKRFSEGMGMPGDMTRGMLPWASGSRLEGVWEGRNGELLIVQGDRFRIYPGNAGYVEGYLQLSGDRLAMYNPEDANLRPFEYAESQGRLVLRGEAGSLYLYRRLWLDKDQQPAAVTPPEK